MINIQDLMKDFKYSEFKAMRSKTGMHISQLSLYKKGKTMQTTTAFRLLQALDQPLPCDPDNVNGYMRELWDKSEHTSIIKVSGKLGLSENTLARWIYCKRESSPRYDLFLMFCKYMGTDYNINKYTHNGV